MRRPVSSPSHCYPWNIFFKDVPSGKYIGRMSFFLSLNLDLPWSFPKNLVIFLLKIKQGALQKRIGSSWFRGFILAHIAFGEKRQGRVFLEYWVECVEVQIKIIFYTLLFVLVRSQFILRIPFLFIHFSNHLNIFDLFMATGHWAVSAPRFILVKWNLRNSFIISFQRWRDQIKSNIIWFCVFLLLLSTLILWDILHWNL